MKSKREKRKTTQEQNNSAKIQRVNHKKGPYRNSEVEEYNESNVKCNRELLHQT